MLSHVAAVGRSGCAAGPASVRVPARRMTRRTSGTSRTRGSGPGVGHVDTKDGQIWARSARNGPSIRPAAVRVPTPGPQPRASLPACRRCSRTSGTRRTRGQERQRSAIGRLPAPFFLVYDPSALFLFLSSSAVIVFGASFTVTREHRKGEAPTVGKLIGASGDPSNSA